VTVQVIETGIGLTASAAFVAVKSKYAVDSGAIGPLRTLLEVFDARVYALPHPHDGSVIGREALAAALGGEAIAYRWHGDALGGRRSRHVNSPAHGAAQSGVRRLRRPHGHPRVPGSGRHW
jgi:hypothetical protein